MPTSPLNPERLWKGKLSQSNNKPLLQPPMVLPRIKTLTGGHFYENFYDAIPKKTQEESIQYWINVEKRKKAYRENSKKQSENVFDKLYNR